MDKYDKTAKMFEDRYYRGTFKRSELADALREAVSESDSEWLAALKWAGIGGLMRAKILTRLSRPKGG